MSQIIVELQEFMGSDRSIAEAAWTSSAGRQAHKAKSEKDIEKLVTMLATHKHSTPFESVVMRFWIRMPIQTDRQHMTHRVATHNGMSGRYRTMPSQYLDMPEDVQVITEKAFDKLFSNDTASERIIEQYYVTCHDANLKYQQLLKRFKEAEKLNHISNDEYKRAREFYRGMLPQNNMTERVSIFNLRSFANYQKLRNTKHAQPEIQIVAQKMLEEVKKHKVAPFAISLLEANGWNI